MGSGARSPLRGGTSASTTTTVDDRGDVCMSTPVHSDANVDDPERSAPTPANEPPPQAAPPAQDAFSVAPQGNAEAPKAIADSEPRTSPSLWQQVSPPVAPDFANGERQPSAVASAPTPRPTPPTPPTRPPLVRPRIRTVPRLPQGLGGPNIAPP